MTGAQEINDELLRQELMRKAVAIAFLGVVWASSGIGIMAGSLAAFFGALWMFIGLIVLGSGIVLGAYVATREGR